MNAPVSGSRWRILLKLAGLLLLIVAANLAADGVAEALRFELRPSNEDLVHRMVMISAVAYALLIAIPFVPGVEIGLTLIGMLGPPIVFLVYLSTLAGLSTSFIVGRLISLQGLIGLLDDLRFRKASRMLGTIAPMTPDDRIGFLVANAPNRFVPFLVRHRYIALAILLNLPGNIVIGGGGGIALMAGASRLYSVPGFLATIILAVAPLPLAILVFGKEILAG